MELKEFIKTTLLEITNGVIEAQKELKETGCLINPQGLMHGEKQIEKGYDDKFRSVQTIKMKIAVSVSENTGRKSGIGVAKIITAGVNTEQLASNEQVTTLEFDVPIALPVTDLK